MKVLGIIPARGGSKGIPRKNIRLVAGKPLIAYSIEAAQRSCRLDTFVTSTDDEEIAEVARCYGSEVLMRPAKLASDEAPMVRVVRHCLDHFGASYHYGTILQPTSPLRTGEDIDAALTLLMGNDTDSVVGVYQVADNHPARMYTLEAGRLVPYEKEPVQRLRQKLRPVFHRNGAVYAFTRRLVEEDDTLIGAAPVPYIMPKHRSVNIDDELDLILADAILQRLQTSDDSHIEC